MLGLAGLIGVAAIGLTVFSVVDDNSDDDADDDKQQAGGDAEGEGPAGAPDLLAAAFDAEPPDGAQMSGDTGDTGGEPVVAQRLSSTMMTDAPATGDPDGQGVGIIDGGADGETLSGTNQADRIGGRDGDDTIAAGAGDDEIRGGRGDDTLDGGAGDDILHGEDGADALHGGAGDDRLFGHNGDDTLAGGAEDDELTGSAGNDTLHGGAGDDALQGGLGDDRLDGGMGSDTLFGGHGDDTLVGVVDDPDTDRIDDIDGGRDFLNGGGGDDTILAGRDDVVTTGSGADTVILGDWLDAEHQAEIVDFSAETDMLVVMYDDAAGPEPNITLAPDAEDPAAQHLLLDGVKVAHIANAAGLTPGHVALMPQKDLPSPGRP